MATGKVGLVFYWGYGFSDQAPNTNWTLVMENLDHEGFYIPNEQSFSLFMSIYRHACQVFYIYFCFFIGDLTHTTFFLKLFLNQYNIKIAGFLSTACHIQVYLEECWWAAIYFQVCYISTTWNIYICSLCPETGMNCYISMSIYIVSHFFCCWPKYLFVCRHMLMNWVLKRFQMHLQIMHGYLLTF